MKNILFLGYSGHQNFGDDLLLYQAYQSFKNLGSLSIWTNNTTQSSDYLYKWFPEAKIIKSKKLTFRLIRKYDKILYFGGGVFFDYANMTYANFLKKQISIIKNFYLPVKLGSQYGGIGIGLGPFKTLYSKRINKKLLNTFTLLDVRDEESFKIAKAFKLKAKLAKSVDLSFSLNTFFPKNFNLEKQKKSILICPRKFPHDKSLETYHKSLITFALNKQKEGFDIQVFGFQPNHDEPILKIYEDAGIQASLWDPFLQTIDSVIKLFAQKELVISARMHGIYLAGLVGTNSIGINVHPKIEDATNYFKNSACINPQETTVEKLNKLEYHLFYNLKFNALHSLTNNIDHLVKLSQDSYRNAQEWINS